MSECVVPLYVRHCVLGSQRWEKKSFWFAHCVRDNWQRYTQNIQTYKTVHERWKGWEVRWRSGVCMWKQRNAVWVYAVKCKISPLRGSSICKEWGKIYRRLAESLYMRNCCMVGINMWHGRCVYRCEKHWFLAFSTIFICVVLHTTWFGSILLYIHENVEWSA